MGRYTPWRKDTSTLKVGPIQTRRGAGAWRVEADVDGVPLWFESRNIPLHPSPEAFTTALRIPALRTSRTLHIAAPLCRTWLDNDEKLQALLHHWWKYPIMPLRSAGIREPSMERNESCVLCFTGGVDSFYTLLSGEASPHYLLFVHGYDIPLGDSLRMREFHHSLNHVAEAVGAKPLVVATNLRIHPAFHHTDWTHAHGGALAAVGHLLQASAGRLLIPSSFTYDNFHPWGTNWQLDPLWSSSGFRVDHADASSKRPEKLARIHRSELVRNHLRVCWENRGPWGNCSRCEKCVRTMIGISLRDDLRNFPVFDRSVALADRIRGLRTVSSDVISAFHHFLASPLDHPLEPSVRNAIGELVARSDRGYGRRFPPLLQFLRNPPNRPTGNR